MAAAKPHRGGRGAQELSGLGAQGEGSKGSPAHGSCFLSHPTSWGQCLGFYPLGQLLGGCLSQASGAPRGVSHGWVPGAHVLRGEMGRWVHRGTSPALGVWASSLGPTRLGAATLTGFQDCHLSCLQGGERSVPAPG